MPLWATVAGAYYMRVEGGWAHARRHPAQFNITHTNKKINRACRFLKYISYSITLVKWYAKQGINKNRPTNEKKTF